MAAMSQSSPCLWTRLPQSSRSPCDRYKHACCSHDGNVYILGGRNSSGLGDFWRYSVGKGHTYCSLWGFTLGQGTQALLYLDPEKDYMLTERL